MVRSCSLRWTAYGSTYAPVDPQEYVDPAHAAEAVAKYNEGHFLGSQIKVELSLARTPLPKDGALVSQPLQRRTSELTHSRTRRSRKDAWSRQRQVFRRPQAHVPERVRPVALAEPARLN